MWTIIQLFIGSSGTPLARLVARPVLSMFTVNALLVSDLYVIYTSRYQFFSQMNIHIYRNGMM